MKKIYPYVICSAMLFSGYKDCHLFDNRIYKKGILRRLCSINIIHVE